jgi:hypothetical protein
MNQPVHEGKISSSRRSFTDEEDRIIKSNVAEKGTNCWNELGIILNRNPKQIRDRYNHHLKEQISDDLWSEEENQLLRDLMESEYSVKWSKMEKFFNGRNQNQIKNQWKKLLFDQKHSVQQNRREELQLLSLPQQLHRVIPAQNTLNKYPDYNPPDDSVSEFVYSLENDSYEYLPSDENDPTVEWSSDLEYIFEEFTCFH